ncbi:MAG: N-acetylmuramoyl-L-alanine amidase [Bilifractor sp.]|jgi:N-acetylmuramoyl-L-alanine amidase
MDRKKRKKLIRAVAAAALAALLAAGCSLPGKDTASSSASGQEDVAAVTDEAVSSSSAAVESSSAGQESTESVSSSSESVSSGSDALQAVAVSPEETEEVYVTAYDVNVRVSPSKSADIYTSLKEGTEVEVTGEENGWYEISLDGGTYYIRSDLVEMTTKSTSETASSGEGNGKTVVIDPGHQAEADNGQEPIGPGASQTKAKVTSGSRGTTTGLEEYELNLTIGLKLQAVLQNAGCNVIMTRTTNDVDISNSERAQVANQANADAFVRVHANGSENSSANGAMTICQTASNPYNGTLYSESKALATDVLDSLVSETGCAKQEVWETDTMSGINWCKVPATIVEVGYLTNASEEQKLSTDEYQQKVAQGIADGVLKFLNE